MLFCSRYLRFVLGVEGKLGGRPDVPTASSLAFTYDVIMK